MRGMADYVEASGALRYIRETSESLAKAGITAASFDTSAVARRFLEAQDEQTREALRRIAENTSATAVMRQLVTDQSRANLEALRRATDRNSRFAKEAIVRWLGDVQTEQLRQLTQVMESARAAAVVDLKTGFAEVVVPAIPVEERPMVDGLAALPLVYSRLSPTRRRELGLRLAALALATYVLLAALAADERATVKLLTALLMNFWLYGTVLSAIEEAEDQLRREADETDSTA
jgi:hypothetical protein